MTGRGQKSILKQYRPVQVSLAELKQEVNAAKSLSNSASSVLQTNASLLEAQHRIVTPKTAASARAVRSPLKLEDSEHVPAADAPACKDSPATGIMTIRPEAIQWLATGVSQALSYAVSYKLNVQGDTKTRKNMSFISIQLWTGSREHAGCLM